MGSVYRSPRMSKTIVRPSGETSSEIHDASSVVNLSVRLVMSGSVLVRVAARAELSFCVDVWAEIGAAAMARTAAARRSRGMRCGSGWEAGSGKMQPAPRCGEMRLALRLLAHLQSLEPRVRKDRRLYVMMLAELARQLSEQRIGAVNLIQQPLRVARLPIVALVGDLDLKSEENGFVEHADE